MEATLLEATLSVAALESTASASESTAKAAARTAKATAESTATAKAASVALLVEAALEALLRVAAVESGRAAKAALEASAAGRLREAVLAHLDHAAVPIEAVVHLHRVGCVVGRGEDDDAAALGTAVRSHVDVGAHDVARAAEQVLEVLPARLVWQL